MGKCYNFFPEEFFMKEKILYIWKIPSFPVLFLINTIFGLSMSFFAPFSSLFGIDEVGMSNASFGIFMTVMAIGGVTISSYIAKRSDTKTSRRKLLMITSITGVLGYTSFAFIRDYFTLMVVAFILLGTTAAAVPQLWAYARDALKAAEVPGKDTPFIMNVLRMFFALAWTVGPALGAWLLVAVDFKGLFLFAAAGYFLAFLTIVFSLKELEQQPSVAKASLAVKNHITKPHIFAYLAAALLLSAATSIHMLNVPQLVTKVLGGTEMDVGVIFSVPPIFEVPFMIILGIIAIKMDNGLLVKIGFGIAFIYFLLFSFVSETWQIYPLQILSAAQVSITSGIAVSYFQDFIPEAQGTATTLYMNATQIGQTVGYLLFGFLSEFIHYDSIVLIYALLVGIGLLFLVLLGKQKVSIPPKINEMGMK
ncbi:MFS transporter [Robertmurraya yapensis]|uniref:MFS transporter n=2 Tax=Bacillus yapensis TaxID=2492960 RepID=A0A431WF04_9BACI|nr:MFS transporter [Bacillus yapensis]TKS97216.1 MFS transporter [Bacillus yapensis]